MTWRARLHDLQGRAPGSGPSVSEARAKVEALTKAGRFKRPIVTAIEPFRNFYRAEDYHQRYFEKNGLPSCHVNIPEL